MDKVNFYSFSFMLIDEKEIFMRVQSNELDTIFMMVFQDADVTEDDNDSTDSTGITITQPVIPRKRQIVLFVGYVMQNN